MSKRYDSDPTRTTRLSRHNRVEASRGRRNSLERDELSGDCAEYSDEDFDRELRRAERHAERRHQ